MRGHGEEQIARWFRQVGFVDRVVAEASPGDVLLAFPATLQAHLGVRTPTGFVEANALLRRVVERPWLAGDGWHSAWRFEGGDA